MVIICRVRTVREFLSLICELQRIQVMKASCIINLFCFSSSLYFSLSSAFKNAKTKIWNNDFLKLSTRIYSNRLKNSAENVNHSLFEEVLINMHQIIKKWVGGILIWASRGSLRVPNWILVTIYKIIWTPPMRAPSQFKSHIYQVHKPPVRSSACSALAGEWVLNSSSPSRNVPWDWSSLPVHCRCSVMKVT